MSNFLTGDNFPHLTFVVDFITGEHQADDEQKRRCGAGASTRGVNSPGAAASAPSFPSISDFCVTAKQAG